jgi:hypothetical protein
VEWLLASAVAGSVTVLDLDRTFYVPASAKQRRRLWAWWWAFVLLNAILAGIAFQALRGLNPFNEWNEWGSAAVVGFTYLALVRLKFSTFSFQGQDVPFGLEFFYESAKEAVFRRINGIARRARVAEAEAKATAPLIDLALEARSTAMNDALLSDEERKRVLDWVAAVVEAENLDDNEKRIWIATYLCSGTLAPV